MPCGVCRYFLGAKPKWWLMNGISRPWRAGFIGRSGCSVGAGNSPKTQEKQ